MIVIYFLLWYAFGMDGTIFTGLARRVANKRKDAGDLYPQDLRTAAKEIGISASTLCRIQNGKLPDIKALVKVSRWLGVGLDELVSEMDL